ncbi:hypothetical protein FQA39_LY01595 [Lamprigera yunnana]|nr:hypothetical protein FQA39_LY01595 [Lamprigera yunnana]
MASHWEEFYSTHLPPSDFEDNRKLLKEFCVRHNKLNQRIVLITSGGTTVPLEHNTVRFVDNFSAGTRGAASAEYFLDHGYTVIFLHRVKSLEPFTRHFTGQMFMDMLELNERGPSTTITVKPDCVDIVAPILTRYKSAQDTGQILFVAFTTVSDYFWLLRAACECLATFETKALLYLAAAVSDFYIPSNEIPTHKIQSGAGALNISLQLVPKLLAPIVNLWVPHAYVVSFKLETDEGILITKARDSMNKYKHKENSTDIKKLPQSEQKKKQFPSPFGNRIYISHPENRGVLFLQKPLEHRLMSGSLCSIDNYSSNYLSNGSDRNVIEVKSKILDGCTQTSKTIMQLAEVESKSLSPDSLTSAPQQTVDNRKNFPNKLESKLQSHTSNGRTPCTLNYSSHLPFIRKTSLKHSLHASYSSSECPEDNIFLNASLMDTFLEKKLSACQCRSEFLQQTSPLRRLTALTSKGNFKSQSCVDSSSPNHQQKFQRKVPTVSRFTVKSVSNQKDVDEDPFLFSLSSETKNVETQNNLDDMKTIKKSPTKTCKRATRENFNKRAYSFMSPTLASEQKNQQRLMDTFKQLMWSTKRGKSLSPCRSSFVDNVLEVNKDRIPYSEETHFQEFSVKPLEKDIIKSDRVEVSLSSSALLTDHVILQALNHIRDNDWSESLKGLLEITECCRRMDTDLLYPYMTTVHQKLLQLLHSPRSHVCRTACQVAGRLFEYVKDTRRPEFDNIVEVLLFKTADASKFIQKDANMALDCMVTHIPIYHAVRTLCLKGPFHKNPLVRTATLRLVVCAVVIACPGTIVTYPGFEATRKRLVKLLPHFLSDKHCETRKYGERLYKMLAKEKTFENVLRKYLELENLEKTLTIIKTRNL